MKENSVAKKAKNPKNMNSSDTGGLRSSRNKVINKITRFVEAVRAYANSHSCRDEAAP
jgi:hypothetical protein